MQPHTLSLLWKIILCPDFCLSGPSISSILSSLCPSEIKPTLPQTVFVHYPITFLGYYPDVICSRFTNPPCFP